MAEAPLCWVLTETEHPFNITAASDIWYATWQLDTDAIGQPISILNKRDCEVRQRQTIDVMWMSICAGSDQDRHKFRVELARFCCRLPSIASWRKLQAARRPARRSSSKLKRSRQN